MQNRKDNERIGGFFPFSFHAGYKFRVTHSRIIHAAKYVAMDVPKRIKLLVVSEKTIEFLFTKKTVKGRSKETPLVQLLDM